MRLGAGISRTWRLALAIALAATALLAPTAIPAAWAADGLDIKVDATYRVDVDDAVVRVRLDVVVTNRTPDRTVAVAGGGTRTTQYYFNGVYLPIQLDTRNVRATSGTTGLGTTITRQAISRRLEVRFPNLYHERSRSFRVEYDIVAGKPRSDSDIRVGPAFATFTAWAVGDARTSTVRIVLPPGFEDDGYGEDVTTSTADGRQTLRSGTIADPGAWYRVVSAAHPEALTSVEVPRQEVPIVVHAWPDDRLWLDTVTEVLADGGPVLPDLIDLPWPVLDDLDVFEVHSPLLEGYGGLYDPRTDEIRMGEDLDPHLILHEASHAWFDTPTMGQRWIAEGLADTYSAMAVVALDRDEPERLPGEVTPDDPAAFPLSFWPAPGRIDDDETAAREDYGYAASWTLMRMIVDDVGVEGMQDVFQALDDRRAAYLQEGRSTHDLSAGGWRRFLDLLEEVGEAEGMTDRFRTWVVQPGDVDELDARLAARERLVAMEAAGAGWAPPRRVIDQMVRWRFADAVVAMDSAVELLADRDALATAEATLGTSAPADLEDRYERIENERDADDVASEIAGRHAAATELIATRATLAVEPSLLAQIGLFGERPAAGLDAGVTAYAAGDLDAALAGAAASIAVIAGAEGAGQERVVIGVAVALGILLLLLVVTWSARRLRRRRRRRATLAAAVASTTLAALTEPRADVDPLPSAPPPGADAD